MAEYLIAILDNTTYIAKKYYWARAVSFMTREFTVLEEQCPVIGLYCGSKYLQCGYTLLLMLCTAVAGT